MVVPCRCGWPIEPCTIVGCDHDKPWSMCKGWRHITRYPDTRPVMCPESWGHGPEQAAEPRTEERSNP